MIIYYERPNTLSDVKMAVGKSVELIAAGDLPTIEAAVRLYQKVDAIIAEKSTTLNTAIATLRLAEQAQAKAKRVLMVEHDAMAGVYDAVHDRTVDALLFLPLKPDQLRDILAASPAAVEGTQQQQSASPVPAARSTPIGLPTATDRRLAGIHSTTATRG